MKKKSFLLIFCFVLFRNLYAQSYDIKYADSLCNLGKYTKAIKIYKQSNNPNVNAKIADALLATGNLHAALEYYSKAKELNPSNLLLKFKYAKLLHKTKKYDEAINAYYELIELDNKNPSFYYELGLLLDHLKKTEANHVFHKVYQLDSTHQKAIFKIAKIHLQSRKYDSVNFYTDKGLKYYSNNTRLISLKAQSYYNNKDYSQAIKWFKKLIDLNESKQYIHEELSICYEYTYQPKLAIEQRLLALEFDSQSTDNLLALGLLYEQINKNEKAEKYYKKAIKILDKPLDKEYVRLGYILLHQNKYKEAILNLKIAQKENPNNLSAHFFLINAKDRYYQNLDKSIKNYKDFIEKYPNCHYAIFAKKRLIELKKEQFLKK